MDPNFMNNLSDMMKNGNIPDDIKNLLNNFKNNNNSNAELNNSNMSEARNSNNINPDLIKNMMSMFNNTANSNNDNGNQNPSSTTNTDFNIDMNMLFKVKSIMDKMNSNKNDPRSNLLLSLKPYLKESRKSKVEQYIGLLNMSKVMEAFNQNGGENIK